LLPRLPLAAAAALLLALTGFTYAHVLAKLVTDWWRIPDFSHGFLVPVFAAWLIWERRATLRALVPRPDTAAGLALCALGLMLLLVGAYGSELFLSRVSLVLLILGFTLTFGGRPFLSQLRFPILILLLAIPLPELIFNKITFPLQLLASRMASDLLPWFGVPVLREGNVIRLPLMDLEVAEACSGIRSLLSLFTMAVFYGYFLEKSPTRRVLLALAAIPIAIAANAVRILGTGLCVQYWDPDKAMGFFHEFSGWVMFVVSLGLLYALHRAMDMIPRRGPTGPGPNSDAGSEAATPPRPAR
jgi:exosortase